MANDIINIINNVGFPITCVLGLCWYVKYVTEQSRTTEAEMRKEHKEEVSKMIEAVNNNTLVLQRLIDKLDKED